MEYKWIAQDEGGIIDKYQVEPYANGIDNNWGGCGWLRVTRGNPNPNWLNSLINLETHDYKIDDGILMKVEKQKIFKGSELQFKHKDREQWENCPNYFEYRIKPKTVKFRNYLTKQGDVYATSHKDKETSIIFVRWLGDWQEVEIE